MENSDLRLFKAQAQAELNRLEAESTAKEVAGKAIGKYGLAYITAAVMEGTNRSPTSRSVTAPSEDFRDQAANTG